ncbi:SIR2 family protein [Bacillus cereus]|uniref:SIR2 family protein n=1 Tax=Bacillus cereus TaxID=1396 RepID=UPI0015959529|nr:SIR2 family protein [Bacillus cereus]
MNTPDYTQTRLISNIATDLLSHNTTFFIGAGFSRDLGYPSWGELLIKIIKDYSLMDKIKDSNLFNFLSEDEDPANKKLNEKIVENLIGVDFLRLAGYVDLLLKEEKNKDIKIEINNTIQDFENRRKDKKERYDRYKEIFSFISHYITELITTNYDTNLEYCIDNHIVIHRNLSSLSNPSRTASKDNIKIYKIHGCIKDNDNGIIITEKDYQDFSSSNKYIFHKIYSTLMENNMVFIGYSLDDPNIRGLLSEVLEEIKQNKEAKKKIYWVNRGTINQIDKRFYENMYSIQIIDQIEILDFFDTLIKLTTAKWNNAKLIEEQWAESTMELLSPSGTSEIQFNNIIYHTINAGKYSDVLNHIYQSFITNSSPRGIACNAFFTILSKIQLKEAEKFDSKIIDILQMEDVHLFHIVDLIQKDAEVKKLFITKEYDKILLDSLISRARTNTSFYEYESNAKVLLEYYKAFNGQLGESEERFIDAFYYNYCYLTNTRTLGYAFESLRTVQGELNNFNEDTVVKILERYPTTRKSSVQIEQINALITSYYEPARQNEMLYQYIVRPLIKEKLQRSISNVLYRLLAKDRGFEYDIEMVEDLMMITSYKSATSNGEVIAEEKEDNFTITYNDNSLIINILPDLENGVANLEAGEQVFKNIDPDKIRDMITPIIEEAFNSWGLLTQATV